MTKPFNLADAKLGHPVACTNDMPLEIFKYDYPMSGTTKNPLIVGVLYKEPDNGFVTYWMQDGKWFGGGPKETGNLVMAPLGTVDGREVYPGDMLSHCGGEPSPVPHGVQFYASEWVLPAPVRNYPVTHLVAERLAKEVSNVPYPVGYVAAANTAIKHGIDNGYLIDPALLDKLSVAIDDTATTPELFVDLVVKRIASLEAQVTEQARTIAVLQLSPPEPMSGPEYLRERLTVRTAALDAIGVNLTGGPTYKGLYERLPELVRMREVVIASHFYDKGTSNEFSRVSINRTRMEYIAAELTKVK